MSSIVRFILPYGIIGISIIILILNERYKNNYLVYGMIGGTFILGLLGVILKYIFRLGIDIGLFVMIGCFLGEIIGVLKRKK